MKAYIPAGARWYLAELILESTIEGDARNVVHVNMHLIEAGSPEQAYEKALELGREGEHEYLNTDGKQVRVAFRGLSSLGVIHDELADGAELVYQESVGLTEEELRRWLTPKEELHVFAPRQQRMDGPNYMPEEIMKGLETEGFSRDDIRG